MTNAVKFRVDRVLDPGIHTYTTEVVGWFVRFDDALTYVRAFATDPLNTRFDFTITEERYTE